MNLKELRHVHLIGLGGINVSAIGKLLLSHKIKVSGSDAAASEITRELEALGAPVAIGQRAENIGSGVDLVIYTDAVPAENLERQAATRRGIKSLSAFQFWGEYAKDKKVVAVSGTNGKSTTAAMLGLVMEQAGLDPTVVVGTRVLQWQSNIRLGRSKWLVIEADEYHAHMLEFRPHLAVITNLAADHLDYYKDLDDIVAHFQKWLEQIQAGGGVVINAEDEPSGRLALGSLAVRRFSVKGKDGLRAAGLTVRSGHDSWVGDTSFNIVDDKEDWGAVDMRLPGLFNVANALAAAGAADLLGIKRQHVIRALNKFQGTWRRFEMVGEYKGALIVSDYAHHPDGIRATLEASRDWYPFKRIIVLYQPHQHNRTRRLFDDFVTAFDKCDELILAEIYDVAGRESLEDQAVSSKDLVTAIKNHPPAPSSVEEGGRAEVPPPVPRRGLGGGITPDHVSYAPDLQTAEQMLREKIQKGDVVIVMGAGDVDSVARRLIGIS